MTRQDYTAQQDSVKAAELFKAAEDFFYAQSGRNVRVYSVSLAKHVGQEKAIRKLKRAGLIKIRRSGDKKNIEIGI